MTDKLLTVLWQDAVDELRRAKREIAQLKEREEYLRKMQLAKEEKLLRMCQRLRSRATMQSLQWSGEIQAILERKL